MPELLHLEESFIRQRVNTIADKGHASHARPHSLCVYTYMMCDPCSDQYAPCQKS
jgi:hypothetical protein